MSNSESFIQEVSEEVRRDRLFALLKRYGWIPVLAILLIVGGTAWSEWQKSRAQSAAQENGDALLNALEAEAPAEALSALAFDGPARAISALSLATEQLNGGEPDAARATLRGAAADPDLPQIYRSLAGLKALMIPGGDATPEERITALESYAAPGAPFRMLALEQIALVEIERGETEAAIELFGDILVDAEATDGVRRRAGNMLFALGADPNATALAEDQP